MNLGTEEGGCLSLGPGSMEGKQVSVPEAVEPVELTQTVRAQCPVGTARGLLTGWGRVKVRSLARESRALAWHLVKEAGLQAAREGAPQIIYQ